jgi:hypothetical protein
MSREAAARLAGCAYLFGAICPQRETGAAIVMQRADILISFWTGLRPRAR